jgi:arylsulfatase
VAGRWNDWKVVFLENRGEAFGVWREPSPSCGCRCCSTCAATPSKKSQHNSNTYNDWFLSRVFVIVPIQGLAAQFLQTMKDYPPSQTPGSFNLSKIEEQLRRSN